MKKPAVLIGWSPITISPAGLTSWRSETRIRPNGTASGLIQKWSVSSGSRAVMCPDAPRLKPNFAKTRKAAASCCLRCRRSTAGSGFDASGW